ncbi:MAG: hypothetical protein K0Q59_1902 [Paenibacillus sp.]|jgi:spore germination protein|nr:hypothetical protein [Paenibacillus sp.]
MVNRRITACLLGISLIAAGCGDQHIIERTGFIQSTSHDLLPNGKLQYAISLPIANPKIHVSRSFFKTIAENPKEARMMFARQTNLMLVSGQLRSALFGTALAKAGIWRQMDTLIRDPTISEQVKIIIVEGEAGSLLGKKYKEFPRTGQYIDRLIEKEARGNLIPETTLYTFVRDYYDDGIDPITPIIKDTGETISITGIGLFQDGKYVDKINADDSIIFSLLLRSFRHGEINIDLRKTDPKSKVAMLTSLNNTRNIRVSREKNGQTNVSIEVEMKASLLEYIGGLDLSRKSNIRKLEQSISSHISKRAEQIVSLLQKKKVDSLGIGKYVRNSMDYKEWERLDWRNELPKVNISCSIKIKIKDSGFRR